MKKYLLLAVFAVLILNQIKVQVYANGEEGPVDALERNTKLCQAELQSCVAQKDCAQYWPDRDANRECNRNCSIQAGCGICNTDADCEKIEKRIGWRLKCEKTSDEWRSWCSIKEKIVTPTKTAPTKTPVQKPKTTLKCQTNQVEKDGQCVCQPGFEEVASGKCEIVCDANKKLQKDSSGQKCICQQLYRHSEKLNDCLFTAGTGLNFDNASYDKFQELVEKMEENKGEVFEGLTREGKKIRLGILRLTDGSYLFTSDGRNYFDNPKNAARPGLITKIGVSLGNLSRSLKLLIGIGKYTGRDTAGNPDLQKDKQSQLDASDAAFQNLRNRDKNDPQKKGETNREIFEKHYQRMTQILGEKWEDLTTEELKNATGVDIELIKKLLTGDFSGIAIDTIKQVFSPTFPAEAVLILAKELRNANFASAVSLFIRERQSGKSPAQIFALMVGGQLPELDFVTSIKGVGLQYARGSLFMAYEEAYQRYLLSRELLKK